MFSGCGGATDGSQSSRGPLRAVAGDAGRSNSGSGCSWLSCFLGGLLWGVGTRSTTSAVTAVVSNSSATAHCLLEMLSVAVKLSRYLGSGGFDPEVLRVLMAGLGQAIRNAFMKRIEKENIVQDLSEATCLLVKKQTNFDTSCQSKGSSDICKEISQGLTNWMQAQAPGGRQ